MPTLVIDASSPTLFAGVIAHSSWQILLHKEIGALEGLFPLAQEIFAKFPLNQIDHIALCEGPGRLMSLRAAAVAANEWCRDGKKKMSVYNSLHLAALASAQPVSYPIRTGTWATWVGDKMETSAQPSANVLTLAQLPYSAAVDKLPTLAEKVFRPANSFHPPVFAPSHYALAKTFSKSL